LDVAKRKVIIIRPLLIILNITNGNDASWLTLNQAQGSVSDGIVTATVKVNVSENAKVFVNADQLNAPVILRVAGSAQYKAGVVSNRSYDAENGVLTMTVTFKVA